MASALHGILIPFDISSEVTQDYSAFSRAYFVNQTPFLARMSRAPAGSETFNIISYVPRPLTGYTITTALIDTTGTTVEFNNVSNFQVGDVILIEAEAVEITGDITITNTTTGAGTASVRRGRGGTTAATHVDDSVAKLISNSATGGEVDREASRAPRTTTSNYVQTFQYAVQVGGKANAIRNMNRPGSQDLFSTDKGVKMVEMVREMENAFYMGTGEAPSAGGRTKTKGIKALLPASNIVTAGEIADETAYTPLSLLRDLITIPKTAGGRPDVIFMSTDFISGLATWGNNLVQTPAGETVLGTAINEFRVPLLGTAVSLIEAPLLPAGTAFSLTSEDVGLVYIRQEFFINREKRGDAIEGDWVADFGVYMENPEYHGWVEGITGFANPA